MNTASQTSDRTRRAAAELTRELVAERRAAVRRSDEIDDGTEGDEDMSKFRQIACDAMTDAETHLLRAAIAWGRPPGWLEDCEPERLYFPPCGFVLDETLYLAIPREQYADAGMRAGEGLEDDTTSHVMQLVVVPFAAITDLDAAAKPGPTAAGDDPYEDEEDEHDEGERPGPAGGVAPFVTKPREEPAIVYDARDDSKEPHRRNFFRIVTECYELYQSGRDRDDLETVIIEEVKDMSIGPVGRREDERVLWRDCKALALIRKKDDGEVEVVRLDGPVPVVSAGADLGDDEDEDEDEDELPGPPPEPPAAPELTEIQKRILSISAYMGENFSIRRLMLGSEPAEGSPEPRDPGAQAKPFKVCGAGGTFYHSGRSREDLEGVLRDEVAALHRAEEGTDPDHHRVVWHDDRALAVVRRRAGGEVEVIRLDRIEVARPEPPDVEA